MTKREVIIERQTRVRHARKAKWIKAKGGKCVKCGSVDSLEFDHIDPATLEFRFSWTQNEEAMVREMDKCQLLCEACHKEKTSREVTAARRIIPHGTVEGYEKFGCNCALCVGAEYGTLEQRLRSIPHGTDKGYKHYWCRCQLCKEAHLEAVRRRKTAEHKAKRLAWTITHGRASTYKYHGCRCDLCRAAATEKHRAYMEQRARKEHAAPV